LGLASQTIPAFGAFSKFLRLEAGSGLLALVVPEVFLHLLDPALARLNLFAAKLIASLSSYFPTGILGGVNIFAGHLAKWHAP
jgi:hypothetical protein